MIRIEKQEFKIAPLIISLLITLSIGAVAGLFTTPQIKGWYLYLHKPAFNPPNWIFGPVWTVLYIMIGIAAYLIWQRRTVAPGYGQARLIYFVQLLLNFSWSLVFFGMHQILLALVVIILLWLSIVFTIAAFAKINKTAAWLLVPYLLWVSFATVLNLSIYMLNR